jgi:hypothetical protein
VAVPSPNRINLNNVCESVCGCDEVLVVVISSKQQMDWTNTNIPFEQHGTEIASR